MALSMPVLIETQDTYIAILFGNMTLSVEADILTFTKICAAWQAELR